MRFLVALPLSILLAGCLARTVVDVVTLPVKAASTGIDKLTTSQEEADRNRGRAIRKQEEREAKERRRALKQQEKRERAAREQYEG